MMQGNSGSLETFWTFPALAKPRPEGVRRSCAGMVLWAAGYLLPGVELWTRGIVDDAYILPSEGEDDDCSGS
jgi:hypothetical protein